MYPNADAFEATADHRTVAIENVPAGWQILNAGERTIELFKDKLARAKMVMWNGPLHCEYIHGVHHHSAW